MANFLLHSLVPQLPKALLGLLIPFLQFVWKRWKDRDHTARRDILLEKIRAKTDQKKALLNLPQTPGVIAALLDIEKELSSNIEELSRLTMPNAEVRVLESAVRPAWARWFLLFTPSGAAAWIVHILFFSIVSICFFTLLSIPLAIADNGGPDMEFISGSVIMLVLLALIAVLLVREANRLDRKATPNAARSWIPNAIMGFAALVIALSWVFSLFNDENSSITDGLTPKLAWITLFEILLAISALQWKRTQSTLSAAATKRIGALREGLLLYVPNKPTGWLAHCFWYFEIFAAGWVAVILAGGKLPFDMPAFLPSVFFLLLCSHKWSRAYRPIETVEIVESTNAAR